MKNAMNKHTRGEHRLLVVSTLALLFILPACKDAGIEPSPPGGNTPGPTGEISFQQQVLPIFTQAGCTGCHGGISGLSVGTVNALMIGGDHGPAITPGDADGSLLIRKISAAPPFGSRMPLGGPYLPDTAVGLIKRWISEGAKNN